jgi:hypothetical protein
MRLCKPNIDCYLVDMGRSHVTHLSAKKRVTGVIGGYDSDFGKGLISANFNPLKFKPFFERRLSYKRFIFEIAL